MKLSPTKEYMLKSLPAYAKAYGGFQWPKKKGSIVIAPDWDPKPECGGGLHGLYRGCGDASLLYRDVDALWYVLEVDPEQVVDLGGKAKVPQCKIVYCGTRQVATSLLTERYPTVAVVYGQATAGNEGTAIAGDYGTATARHWGTATVGEGGTATAGKRGTAIAGDYGTATVGYEGAAIAGDGGTAIAGHEGTAIAGYKGTATAGYHGTATAGYLGTAIVGDLGTATAGYGGTATAGAYGTATAEEEGTAIAGYKGTATAGLGGIIQIEYLCKKTHRRKIKTGYIGEDGLRPNVPYRLDRNQNFVEAEVKAEK